MGYEEIGQAVEHVVGSEPSRNEDRQAPARELVEHDEHAEGATTRATGAFFGDADVNADILGIGVKMRMGGPSSFTALK